MQPKALNCPNCGAAVSSEAPRCEFCRSRLKTVGCSACLGMMFLGSNFCGQCGAEAKGAELLEDEAPGDCPRCSVELQSLKIDDVHIRECGKCGGFWSDPKTFEDICSKKEEQAAVLGFAGSHVYSNSAPSKISYVPCPDCKQLMNRSNFARSSGVIIDMCKRHGVWFEVGELPKIIEFIDKGGLVHQREKEKAAIDDERSRMRDEKRRLEMIERRSAVRYSENDGESDLTGLLRRLFE